MIISALALCLLSACGPQLSPASTGTELATSDTRSITPRTKGSTLEITPRTKGSTYIRGLIALPDHITHDFEVEFRQNNLRITTQQVTTNSAGDFEIQALDISPDQPLYVEARAMKYPGIVLMSEITLRNLPETLHVDLSIPSTSAVYLSRYLNLPTQTPGALMQTPEVLSPINEMMSEYFQSQMQNQSKMPMEEMPQMNESLEKARIMWMKLQN